MSLTDETLRLLGCRGEPDERLLDGVNRVMRELRGTAEFKYVSAFFSADVGQCRVVTEPLTLESEALARHLAGCGEIVLFAATLGAAVDRLMRRMCATRIESAAILQAASAALIEEHCDAAHFEIMRERPGMNLTPRFSPGYGGLPLEYQAPILNILDAGRKIGLSLTDGMMLAPAKSITAIIGVSPLPCEARPGCARCDMKECSARRDDP